ncbi:MAG: hypothetical protein GQE15_20955 [Archangiaceae bacterium]|nr:hypothetical protein [Archangiaceae bacterium]
MAWVDELAAAVRGPRMDQLEALRRSLPDGLSGANVEPIIRRIAELLGRPPDDLRPERLAWWLDALLLQKVIHVPQSRNRVMLPVLFAMLAILLGLLIGRLAAAGVMVIGLVIWAVRAGGSVRERQGDWLRLGDVIFDLRNVRRERLGPDWYLLEGHRVPARVLLELGVVRE